MKLGITKARARQHKVELEGLVLKDIVLAFLQLVRSPTTMYKWLNSEEGDQSGHGKLPIIYTKDQANGVETWQVVYTPIKHVAAFCSFHSFMGHKEGVGALRYDIGRNSNIDYMVVGVPLSFKVMTTRTSGIVKSVMQFNTCHGNGEFGTLTPPHMLRGMLKDEKHKTAVLEYVKKYLPTVE